MAKCSSSPSVLIERLVNDTARPIGERLSVLRSLREQVEKAERQLLIQLGVNVAKDLAAQGIRPTGRPLAETFRVRSLQQSANVGSTLAHPVAGKEGER